jgi:hypothetical protein
MLKCRCSPVTLPVEPVTPIGCPAFMCSFGLTRICERCPYILWNSPCVMRIYLPRNRLNPVSFTMPSIMLRTGSQRAARSTPLCRSTCPVTGWIRIPNGELTRNCIRGRLMFADCCAWAPKKNCASKSRAPIKKFFNGQCLSAHAGGDLLLVAFFPDQTKLILKGNRTVGQCSFIGRR